jgi:hypothetical protein
MRGSLTLTVVFVNWDLWEGEGAEDCVPEGLADCVADVVAVHGAIDSGGL